MKPQQPPRFAELVLSPAVRSDWKIRTWPDVAFLSPSPPAEGFFILRRPAGCAGSTEAGCGGIDGMVGKQAFNARAKYYVKSRPGYPVEVLAVLADQFGLSESSVVADIGSGTGRLAVPFLARGCTVYGVEPNAEMRAAAEVELAGFDRFHSLEGSAEATGLPDAGVDFITAGQSAHWFDVEPAAAEFNRILRPGGQVALVWNSRDSHDAVSAAFSALLGQYPGQDPPPRRPNEEERDRRVLLGRGYAAYQFMHEQRLDFDTLLALALSKSYSPLPGDPHYEPLAAALRGLFDRYARDGRLRLVYTTALYVGRPERTAR